MFWPCFIPSGKCLFHVPKVHQKHLYASELRSSEMDCGGADGLHSFFQVTGVKLGRARSNSGWTTSRRPDQATASPSF